MNGTIDKIELPYLQMGEGFVIGLSVGYAIKKSFKIVLFFTGIIVIGMFLLENQHVISINEAGLQNYIGSGTDAFKWLLTFVKDRLSSLSFAGAGSTMLGFAAGLKMG